jgi:hypothetical protein
MNQDELKVYEYGAMSSLYSIEAKNKLTAYCVMVLHYDRNAFALVIYSPEECKEDSWASFDGKIAARLDEVFGGEGSFDKYFEENIEEIKACYKTLKKLS